MLCLTEGKKEGWKKHHCTANTSPHTGRLGTAFCSTSLAFVRGYSLHSAVATRDVHKEIPWIWLRFPGRESRRVHHYICYSGSFNHAFVFVSSLSYWNISKKVTKLSTHQLLVESCISNERHKILYLHFPLDYFNMSAIYPSAVRIRDPQSFTVQF